MVNIFLFLKSIFLTEITKIKKMFPGPAGPGLPLLDAVNKARQEWQLALKELNQIDSNLTEYAIFKVNATERRYITLLEQAKKEGITAWPPLEIFISQKEVLNYAIDRTSEA